HSYSPPRLLPSTKSPMPKASIEQASFNSMQHPTEYRCRVDHRPRPSPQSLANETATPPGPSTRAQHLICSWPHSLPTQRPIDDIGTLDYGSVGRVVQLRTEPLFELALSLGLASPVIWPRTN
ncbi:MAG: hypothetical protein Q9224_003237, partial [Gallowayella concinna]